MLSALRGATLIKKVVHKLLPRSATASLRNYRILSARYGHYQSASKWQCVDEQGDPIPWYTYPAIEYLKQIDLSSSEVFEFGSGNSTLFWSTLCRAVVSVEDDPIWHEQIEARLPSNVEYLYRSDEESYVGSINEHNQDFDVIVIDGTARRKCAAVAVSKLRDGGLIILDNSDWHPETASDLRKADLIEIDMTGFGPINGYTWTTSLFLSRSFRPRPAFDRQPVWGVGALEQLAEE